VYGPQFRNLANQEFELRKKALDEVITRKLIEKEAAKQSITPEELLRREVESKVADPSVPEIEAFYLGQKDRIGRPFQEVRQQMFMALKQARVQQKRDEFLAGLRKGAQIAILLRPPKVTVAHDPKRTRGEAAATVTIVGVFGFPVPLLPAHSGHPARPDGQV